MIPSPLRRRHRWLGAVGAAVLLLGGTAACGGDDATDETATPVASATVKSYEKSVAGVVEASTAFLDTLSSDEKTVAQLEFTQAKAVAWSNLPCGSTCRPGVMFGDLTDAQVAAGKSVLMTALGTGTGTGYERILQIFAADGYLGGVQASGGSSAGPGGGMSGGPDGGMPGGSGGPPAGMSGGPGGMSGGPDASGGTDSGGGGLGGYDSGNYYLAFLGTPSVTGTWQLHFGGHHLAVNLTFKDGKVEGATPFHVGVEPTSWTDTDGTTHAPLLDMKNAMVAMLAGLSSAEQTKAKIAATYSDIVLGPGSDGKFPATKEGLVASGLTAAQKQLILNAIKPWVVNADDATSATLMSTYESELDKTYVGWSGHTTMTNHADYVRVDGPSVWVEFVCQNGVVIQNQIHYHTVYRDHTRDYGGEFTFS
ncbi:DUF3500 domain-containing protein [Actinoplanes sp. L3-i22]|uniref:DUF3500 domain-containing protein n=1 Tax=Actinoplanes sp. L3-i22 TaxID=2836373 RepID=UPI001C74B445|nr:DUF3500 domain-containing protein [Actinoplanes sp. L3-i22]BCY12419.1 hypothetical protein L3i22_075070 [Actinoplanes sp. L3-i22]